MKRIYCKAFSGTVDTVLVRGFNVGDGAARETVQVDLQDINNRTLLTSHFTRPGAIDLAAALLRELGLTDLANVVVSAGGAD